MYPFLSLQFPAILFFTFFFSILVKDSSLRIQNATKNSVHMTSYADYSESESSQICYFRFQLRARTVISFTWPLFSGIYLSSILLNIMMICMNECPSKLSNQEWLGNDLVLEKSLETTTVIRSASLSAPFTIRQLSLVKQNQASSYFLFIKLVCKTEADRFWTLAFSFSKEISPSWPQKD